MKSAVGLCAILSVAAATQIHKAGYCSTYGVCGRASLFGPDFPCVSNTPAVPLTDVSAREMLVSLCGDTFAEGPVCCDAQNIANLKDNLSRVESLIASCPACRANFFQTFCHFTCSPNQSLFVNVTAKQRSLTNHEIVKEVDFYVDNYFGSAFYNSCSEVQFSATNGRAMDLIGGGAKDYKAFFKFLGDKKPMTGGSPYQINNPWNTTLTPQIDPLNTTVRNCNDSDESYRCACPDCSKSCPALPDMSPMVGPCKVGAVPCTIFFVLLLYSTIALAIAVFTFARGSSQARASTPDIHHTIQSELSCDEQAETANQSGFTSKRNLQGLTFFGSWSTLGGAAALGSVSNSSTGSNRAAHPIAFASHPTLRRPYVVNSWLQTLFYNIGEYCASFPRTVISVTLALTAAFLLGLFNLQTETNPEKLWVSATSKESLQKEFYDEHFGPFYRVEQVFLINDTGGPALTSYDTLEWWSKLEESALQVSSSEFDVEEKKNKTWTFTDFCLDPQKNGACVVNSITKYFSKGAPPTRDSWKSYLSHCLSSPVDCLPDFGLPLKPQVVLGGLRNVKSYLDAPALVTTLLLVEDPADSRRSRAILDWERRLEVFWRRASSEASQRGLRLSFNTGSTIDRELNKSSKADATAVIASYIAMFAYVTFALSGSAKGRSSKAFWKHTDVSSGLVGILVVILAIAASAGFFSMIGVRCTLIILEVIPFLILAIGVDNIFLLCNRLGKTRALNLQGSIQSCVASTLSEVGPSIALSASCEISAFLLAASVAMPAVRNFALYAAIAIMVNTILQLTLFVAFLALNLERQSHAITSSESDPLMSTPDQEVDSSDDREGNDGQFSSSDTRGSTALRLAAGQEVFYDTEEDLVSRWIRQIYAPALFKSKNVMLTVVALFVFWASLSCSFMYRVELGLDQKDAVPQGSSFAQYFDDAYNLLEVGPPVYFVAYDIEASQRRYQQMLCGRFAGCKEYSLANVIEQERKRPEVSYLSESVSSWIDDYLTWINPNLERCCRVRRSDPAQYCPPTAPGRQCESCMTGHKPPYNSPLMSGLPEGKEFMRYFHHWIQSPSDIDCPLGGLAPYGDAVAYTNSTIYASAFRSAHTPLRSQADFINAYAAAQRISKEIGDSTGLKLFAYSPFYIYFAQYSAIQSQALGLCTAAIALAFILSLIILGSLRAALILMTCVISIIVNIVGVMAIVQIPLNAVSLVNLVICVGLGFEFCVHIARAYVFPSETYLYTGTSGTSRGARAYQSLVETGSTIFGGIVCTKLIGVMVLAFAQSKIFEKYYFRVWLSLILIASAHALVLLPVLLRLVGGSGYMTKGELSGAIKDISSRLQDANRVRNQS